MFNIFYRLPFQKLGHYRASRFLAIMVAWFVAFAFLDFGNNMTNEAYIYMELYNQLIAGGTHDFN